MSCTKKNWIYKLFEIIIFWILKLELELYELELFPFLIRKLNAMSYEDLRETLNISLKYMSQIILLII
jgi:hypothetical protein